MDHGTLLAVLSALGVMYLPCHFVFRPNIGSIIAFVSMATIVWSPDPALTFRVGVVVKKRERGGVGIIFLTVK